MKLELRADAEDLIEQNKIEPDYTLTAEEQAWLRYGMRVQQRLTAEEQRWLDAVWEYNAEHLEREEW